MKRELKKSIVESQNSKKSQFRSIKSRHTMQIDNLMQTNPLKLKDLSEASPDDESLSEHFQEVSIKDI